MFATTSFRARLLLLMLLLVLPALAWRCMATWSSAGSRPLKRSKVRRLFSHLAAANQENFIKNTRQLLAT